MLKTLSIFDPLWHEGWLGGVMKITILFLVGLFVSTLAVADHSCPSTIYYKNGNYLKSGSTFYFPNASYAISGSTVYYPNGNYLRSGSTYYYENGNYLKSGLTLYYPNGNYLRSGTTLYYSNGNYLKSGSTFYHKNGNYARSGSTLYREDGSTTPFPVSLSEGIGNYGRVDAQVTPTTDKIDIHFENLTTTVAGVELKLEWDEDDFHMIHMLLNTGHPNENVHVDVVGTTVNCSLLGGAGPDPEPTEFTLTGAAATINVKVRPGVEVKKVREALQRALDAIR